MKKLLGISILAMFAVSPMLANAGTALTGSDLYQEPTTANPQSGAVSAGGDPKYAFVGINTDEQSHIASTAYVKGAYNSAIAAVNKVADSVTTDLSGKQDVLTEGDGIEISNENVISVAVTEDRGLTFDATDDTLEVAVGNGIQFDSNGAVAAKLDGTTLAVGANGLKVNEITTSEISSTTLVDSTDGLGAAAGETGAATDTEIPTALAVRQAIDTAVTSGVSDKQDSLVNDASTPADINSEVLTTVRASGSASDERLVTEKAVASKIESATANMAVEAGVTKTIAHTTITVPIYGTWGSDGANDTTPVTASIAEPTYRTTDPS